VRNIALIPLQEVRDEYCLSPGKITKGKLNITKQFDLKLEEFISSALKPAKDSAISTNPTSTIGYQRCFAKKLKDSHITINLGDQDKSDSHEGRTASKDRFK
jgi:hypothetical protein